MSDYAKICIDRIRKSVAYSKPNISNTELEVRCPYCGDSIKHANKGHCYITMTEPLMFRCVKCETGGYVTERFLHDIGCYDSEALVAALSANREFKKQCKKQNITIQPKNKDIKLPIVQTAQSQACLNYFNSRYNTVIDLETLVTKYKAVTDIDAFVSENNLNISCNFNLRGAIGFLSSDKTYVIFRDITGIQKIRYYNLKLVDDHVTSSRQYTISTPIDLMQDEVTLIMTEGIFDIIGVYNSFYKDDTLNNKIFCATCGKSYVSAINKFFHMGFLNLNIIIYSDSDVKYTWYINKVKNAMPELINTKITIYYNTLEKDYGIPSNRIKLKKVVI